jgi:hypothetical protein
MSGAQAVTMLEALRGVELVLMHQPSPCAAGQGLILYELNFTIPEVTVADTTATLALSSDCLKDYPALAVPLDVANDIYTEQENSLQCR